MRTRPFFAVEKRRRALLAEAGSWVGTPFHAHARLKMVGVDCVQLAGAIYIATGFLTEPQFNIGWYPIDGGHHDEKSRVVEWIEKSGKFARVNDPRIGDTLVMRMPGARVAHHVGVMVSESEFVHAYFKHFVVMSRMDGYRKRIEAMYRPIDYPPAETPQHVRD